MPEEVTFERIEAALKRTSQVLEDAGIPFLLAGSLAGWARGGPETRNDLDLMLRPDDAERALVALAEAGMDTERPAEQWLFKAWDDGVLIDLIFEILAIADETGATERNTVDDELFARAEDLKVFGVLVRVMSLEDLMVTKLLALEPNALDYGGTLAIARSLREEIDWEAVRDRTAESPYATAFFTLVEELGVVSRGNRGSAPSPRVRAAAGPSARRRG
jgi:predicted nucleotidyltransferase